MVGLRLSRESPLPNPKTQLDEQGILKSKSVQYSTPAVPSLQEELLVGCVDYAILVNVGPITLDQVGAIEHMEVLCVDVGIAIEIAVARGENEAPHETV
ncbi:MAG: hypothetical protein ACI841_000606 [Planctomycetota bacterium]|jgi:hypothetical protein